MSEKSSLALLAMAVGKFQTIGGTNQPQPSMLQDADSVPPGPFPQCLLAPETALFFAIDLDRSLQIMESYTGAPTADEVTYYVNKDSAGWVEQRVRRRVYIELKLECTRNRSRDTQKARDDWLCVYCRASFPSKLRLTDHRVVGCPRGPVDSRGKKLELPVYPNLKTAKQGKDLKLAFQHGDGSVWGTLHDNNVWFGLNPELRDVIVPPHGARVQVRRFLQPTVENLAASPAHGADVRPQQKPKPQRTPNQETASGASHFVFIEDDEESEPDTPPSRPKKRPHSQMAEGPRVSCSARQFKAAPRRYAPGHQSQHAGSETHSPHPPRPARPSTGDGVPKRPPSHPLRVAPIQSRSPSPERAALLPPPSPTRSHRSPPPPSPPHVTAAMPHVTRNSPKSSSQSSHDLAEGLRRDRQSFYVKVASGARAAVKMDTPKPALRPPIQPPGLFYLMPCGLLRFDLECGEFQAFQDEVQKWQADPAFMDRFFAAYGRFCAPMYQVQLPPPFCCICGHFCIYSKSLLICMWSGGWHSIYLNVYKGASFLCS